MAYNWISCRQLQLQPQQPQQPPALQLLELALPAALAAGADRGRSGSWQDVVYQD